MKREHPQTGREAGMFVTYELRKNIEDALVTGTCLGRLDLVRVHGLDDSRLLQ